MHARYNVLQVHVQASELCVQGQACRWAGKNVTRVQLCRSPLMGCPVEQEHHGRGQAHLLQQHNQINCRPQGLTVPSLPSRQQLVHAQIEVQHCTDVRDFCCSCYRPNTSLQGLSQCSRQQTNTTSFSIGALLRHGTHRIFVELLPCHCTGGTADADQLAPVIAHRRCVDSRVATVV